MEEEEQQARLTRWLVFKVEGGDDGDGDDDEDDGEDDDEDDDDGDGCKDGVLACTAPIGVTSQPDYRDTAQA